MEAGNRLFDLDWDYSTSTEENKAETRSQGGISIKNVRKMVLCSMLASLTAICAWIAVPLPGVSFTMQTFAVLLTLGTLGGRWGSTGVLLYLLLKNHTVLY